jgi:hypothetical protein
MLIDCLAWVGCVLESCHRVYLSGSDHYLCLGLVRFVVGKVSGFSFDPSDQNASYDEHWLDLRAFLVCQYLLHSGSDS